MTVRFGPAGRAGFDKAPRAGNMIRKAQGRWQLAAGLPPHTQNRRVGKYRFDHKTMRLCDGRGAFVARLVLRPLASEPLGPRPPGRASLPLVSIVSSEVMHEIQDPMNAGAYFVLPSQMNGAEYPDFNQVVSDIGDYKLDRTAGPRGQLAVHPAAGQFLLDNAARMGRKSGVSAVEGLLQALRSGSASSGAGAGARGSEEEFFFVENGYLRVPPLRGAGACGARKDMSEAFERELWRLHTIAACDVPAAGLAPSLEAWSEVDHRVNLVYASAVPVGTYNNPAPRGDRELLAWQQEVGSHALRGAYFGALRLALEGAGSTPSATKGLPAMKAMKAMAAAPKRKVFLMPLGGGVFNNSPAAIAQSLSEALELANKLSAGVKLEQSLDLRLLTWNGKPSEATDFAKALRAVGKLRE